MATRQLADVSGAYRAITCEDNIHVVHMYTRLTANGVLRDFVKKGE